MDKLVDVMGTKYIYASYSTRLTLYLRAHVGETIDLADARLTKTCVNIVHAAISECQNQFIDSKDKQRDHILRHNYEQAVLHKQIKENNLLRVLPIPRTEEDVKKYLADDYGEYCWQPSNESHQALLWAILLQARRPDVKLYTRGVCNKLFRTINQYYDPQYYVGGSVYWLHDTGMDIKEDPDIQFCTSNVCCPVEFGTENLFQNPKWKKALMGMSDAYMQMLKPRGYHIKEFLQGGS